MNNKGDYKTGYSRLLASAVLAVSLVSVSSLVDASPITVTTEFLTDHYAEDSNGNELVSDGTNTATGLQTSTVTSVDVFAPQEVFNESWEISSANFDDVWESLLVDIYTDFSLDAGDTNAYEITLDYDFSRSITAPIGNASSGVGVYYESFIGSNTFILNPGDLVLFDWGYELYGEAALAGGDGEYDSTINASLNITDIRTIPANVPEPSSLALLLLGALGLLAKRNVQVFSF